MHDADEEPPARIPFTILTGFLGAGKTTILNRVLASGRALRTAVLVNDVGRVNVDRQLIRARSGDILELSGGCVCCQVDLQRNLWEGIVDLVQRAAPERIVLETTGIAEPAELIRQLQREAIPRRHLRLAGVACIIDGEAGAEQLARHSEARAQATTADRILLSKLDVASAAQVAAAHAALDAHNTSAERVSFARDDAGDPALTEWLLQSSARDDDELVVPTPHQHSQLAVVTISDDSRWLEAPLLSVIERFRAELVRVKGWLNLAGEESRAFLEVAGARTTLTHAVAPPGRTELVFIGSFDPAALERQLAACRTRADNPLDTIH